MNRAALFNRLSGIVGEANALSGDDDLAPFSAGGVRPGVVLFPGGADEISEVMKLASRDSLAVVPMGAGTKRFLGNNPERADIVISTRRLARLIDHESADLVATAECGIALTELGAGLGSKNQFLPVDPPHAADGATLGGVIASNDSGPMRLRYGTCRELLIGMKVVRADGSIFRGGSKVVKNVAGYDMPKLFVGSLGTLGIIVEATFRLYPVPESSVTCVAGFDSPGDAHSVVKSLLNSNLVLTSLEHVNPALSDLVSQKTGLGLEAGRYHLAVRVMNVEKAVRDQVKVITGLLGGVDGGPVHLLEGGGEEAFWSGVREFSWSLPEEGRAVLKAGVLISAVPGLFLALEKLSRERGVASHASARAGNGAVVAVIRAGEDALLSAIDELRDYCRSASGSLVIADAPGRIKDSAGVWGDLGTGFGLMKRIKSSFDPLNILSPGRIF